MQRRVNAGRLTPEDPVTWHPPRASAMPIVRAGTAADTPEILKLIATSYECQSDPSRLRYWLWKHEQNPFGASPCLVGTSDGHIVGVRMFLRWVWCSGDQTVRAVRAVDTATLPEWRGKGVFSRLTMRLVEQMQDEGVRFIYNTPNGKSMPGYLKMGWAPVTRIPLWVRPVRLSMAARRAFSNVPTPLPTFEHFGTITEVLEDRRLPAFLRNVAIHDERYHTPRTTSYLGWRYGNIPGISVRGPAPCGRRCGSARHRSRPSSWPSLRSDDQRTARHTFDPRRPDWPRSARRSRAQYGRRLRRGLRGKRHGRAASSGSRGFPSCAISRSALHSQTSRFHRARSCSVG